ncbi:MAG: hypothetical protein JXA44_11260 [Methanospirillaceae archaeon]|nr:hypothetical protein [Methanospirillaceae archaeon]
MKIIGVLFTFALLGSLVSQVSGYIIQIDCPSEIQRGIPLGVTGTTTFPQSASFDLVIYRSERVATELARQTIITTPSREFKAVFPTTDMEHGQHKVEVAKVSYNNQAYANSQLGTASVLYRIFKVIDRSDSLHIASPSSQPLDQALLVSGYISNYGNNVVEIRVFGPDASSYGPESAITNKDPFTDNGSFSFQVPVSSPGEYYVSLSDARGFVAEIPFTVTDSAKTVSPLPVVTPVVPEITAPLKREEENRVTIKSPDTPFIPKDSPPSTPTPVSLLVPAIAIGMGVLSQRGKKKK